MKAISDPSLWIINFKKNNKIYIYIAMKEKNKNR